MMSQPLDYLLLYYLIHYSISKYNQLYHSTLTELLSLSFNNDGPLGTFFRYIGDTATYLARYDDLFTGKEEKID